MNNSQRFIQFILLTVILVSCKKETAITSDHQTSQKSLITINLEIDTLNTPFLRAMMPLTYAPRVQLSYRGVPDLDTISIHKLLFVSNDQIKQWNELGYLDASRSRKPIKYGLYAVSGLRDNQQIVMLDTNFDGDFSDEEMIVFNVTERDKYQTDFNARDSLKSFLIEYTGFLDGCRISVPLYLKVLPFNSYANNKPKDQIDLSLTAEEKQFYTNRFVIDSNTYKIALDDGLFGAKILIEPIENKFKKPKDADYLSYKLKDTLNLSNNFYRIDSISPYFKSVILKKLDITKKAFGYRTGDQIKNFEFNPIDGSSQISIEKLLEQKPYLLLDFWGTWCAPCTKLTPDLIALNAKFSDQLNTMSIAVEPNIDNVRRYVEKKQLTWFHHHIPINPKSSKEQSPILEDLFIKTYPTFILINRHGKILYRGTGNSMDRLDTILGKKTK